MVKLYFLLFCFLPSVEVVLAQPTFQGEIRYAVHYRKKSASVDLTNISLYPAKQDRLIIKDGSWILHMDTAKYYKYSYYDRRLNRQYWKLKYSDTLFYMSAADRGGDAEDSLISTRVIHHTDTILGRICERLVLRTKSMTLSLSFDPNIPIDPAWFAAAKLNYYDVVYGVMKSVYLKMVWETADFVVISTATKVERRLVLPGEFPAIDKIPTKALASD